MRLLTHTRRFAPTLALALIVPAGMAARPAPAAAAPAAAGARDVVVQMFDWKWTDIASECANVLGPDGYGAVQISPPEEAVVLSGSGYPWWQSYQPVSYQLGSRFGTQAQLSSMISACHAAGVKVYADVVLNHMTGQGSGGVGDDGTTFADKYDYPPLYTSSNFHSCESSISNWDDESQVWNCQLVGLADLDTSQASVRATEAGYLNRLISLGVDGFRWDSAKEMDPADIAAIESQLSKQVFVYQDVEWGSGQPVTPSLYTNTGAVQDLRYGWDVSGAFRSGSLANLDTLGPSYGADDGLLTGAQTVATIDTQASERDGSALDYADGTQYTLANVFMLAYGFGTPEILSDYAFSSYDQGPPSAGGNAIASVSCGTGTWECEQRWTPIAGMVGWHNAATGASLANWYTDGSGVIAFSRGSAGWVGIDDEGSAVTRTFATGLPAGTYCDVISGALANGVCTGGTVTVGSGGTATVTIPPGSAVAVDVNARPSSSSYTERVDVTVPSSTDGTGKVVYLAGNLSALGGGAGDWAPGGVPMTRVSATEWTTTLTSTTGTALSYKFDLGGSWSNVEETGSCGYVANRALTMSDGTVSDSVAAWAGINGC